MNKVKIVAKSVEEAVQKALQQLNTTKEHVHINVLEEPSRGFLGFGAKDAVVEVEKIESNESVEQHIASDDAEDEYLATADQPTDRSANNQHDPSVTDQHEFTERATQFLQNVLPKMGLTDFQFNISPKDDYVLIEITGSKLGMIIGRRGQTLDSLQYLTNVVANRRVNGYVRFILDAENYRTRRQSTLEQLADRLAKKVIRTRQKVVLEPMNPAERKIIHTQLQNYAGIATKSEGEEPNRKVVIFPK